MKENERPEQGTGREGSGIIVTISKRIALIIVLPVMIVIAILGLSGKSAGIVQPVPFNHNLHVEELDLDCVDCHTQVRKRPRATLPIIDICQDCHMEAITDTDVEEQLLAYATESREIPWQRIYSVPDHVYFSHRRHVTLGNIPCETCHGDIRQLTEPQRYPVIAVTMDSCMSCHEEQQITNDCLACHR